jgi:inner membrane transporter RhtA
MTTAAPPAAAAPRLATGSKGRPETAVLLVLGSCTSFQFGAALATRLFPVTGAVGATLLRLGLAAIVLLAVTRPRVRGWSRAQWRSVILYGVSLAGMNGFYYAALARLPLSAAVTIQFLGPLTLSAALSRRWRDGCWIVLALLGVLTLGLADRHGSGSGSGSGSGGLDPVGVALALVSAAFWALYIVAGSRASAAVPGRSGVAVAMTVGALVLLPFGALGAWHVVGRPGPLLLAFGVAMLASVVPYTLEFAAMRRAPRQVFGILLSLDPALATLAGWLLLRQHSSPVAIAAVAVVITASVGSTLSAGGPRPYHEEMAISDEKYVASTTYRKSGAAVPTQTWICALDGSRVGFWTSSASGKYKRLRNNPSITLQAADARGRVKPGSRSVKGTAELVTSGADFDAIQSRIRAKYGVMVRFTRVLNFIGNRGKSPYGDVGVVITVS